MRACYCIRKTGLLPANPQIGDYPAMADSQSSSMLHDHMPAHDVPAARLDAYAAPPGALFAFYAERR